MRIIITGGTGFIGRKLAASFAADKHEVIVLTRDPAATASKLPPGVRAQRWDARTANGWSSLADGADAIVNLAGENIAGKGLIPSRLSAKRKQLLLESRVYAGLAVVDAVEAAAQKPKVVLQAGAVGYYGARSDDVILTEDSKPGNDFLAQVQIKAEQATAPVEEMGVRRVVTRTGVVMAMEKGSPLPLIALPFRFFVGGRLGSGRQYWSWVHINDVVAAMRFLIENEAAAGAFNVTSPNPVTNREFAKAVGRVMSRPSFFPTPAFALQLALGEISTLVLDGQRAMPKRLLDLGFKFRFPEPYYALRDLIK